MLGSKLTATATVLALGAASSGCWGMFAETPETPDPPAGRRRVVVIDTGDTARPERHAPRAPEADARGTEPELDAAADANAGPDATLDAAAEDDTAHTRAPAPHVILSGEIKNARDLGGTPLPRGQSVTYDAVFRGPPLANLSQTGCTEFSRLGIRTVIDLRIAAESDSTPEAACVKRAATIVAAPLPVPYNVSPADYIADLNATDSIARAFRFFGDDSAYPIYMHCTWGRDRTGVLAAVVLRAVGASRADIKREYLISAETVGAYPISLDAVLDEIERRGGIEVYLASAGVTAEQLASLRKHLVGSPP